jgi:UDP-N-acetylmuramate dehydrogenase
MLPLTPQSGRSLSEFSTFGIGGPIRFFLEIRTPEEARDAFLWAASQGLETRIIGKGSNSLFSDAPFDGLVLLNKIDACVIDGSEIRVGAGASFSYLGIQSAKQNLAGLEFASGIPATVGGAIWMNAGANGSETCDCLESVLYLFLTGEIRSFSRSELTFGYRTSPFQSMQGCILSAKFLLRYNEEARIKQRRHLELRIKTQPLKAKSAGCIFRNPSKEVSAGALIDQCGLKGLAVGDAIVSPIHANFIVNEGSAKATDVLTLIQKIQATVLEKKGILLEPEIKVW